MRASRSLTSSVIVLAAVCLAWRRHRPRRHGLPRSDLRRAGSTLNVVATLEHYGSIAKSHRRRAGQGERDREGLPEPSHDRCQAELLGAPQQGRSPGRDRPAHRARLAGRRASSREKRQDPGGAPRVRQLLDRGRHHPYSSIDRGHAVLHPHLGVGGTLSSQSPLLARPGQHGDHRAKHRRQVAEVDLPNAAYYRANEEHYAAHLARSSRNGTS